MGFCDRGRTGREPDVRLRMGSLVAGPAQRGMRGVRGVRGVTGCRAVGDDEVLVGPPQAAGLLRDEADELVCPSGTPSASMAGPVGRGLRAADGRRRAGDAERTVRAGR